LPGTCTAAKYSSSDISAANVREPSKLLTMVTYRPRPATVRRLLLATVSEN
jgi:hypothetical protein